jgi:HAD superfamily hydrolase (TIGR01490 family)
MNSQVAAVFDLDRTLTRVRSLESSFISFLLRERHISIASLLCSAGFFLRNLGHDPVTAIKRNKMYLKGFSLAETELLTRTFLSRQGYQMIPEKAISLVNRHKQQEHLTILITGAPEFLVRPLIQLRGLPFDRLYATRLEVAGNRYSGKIEGTHFYGKEKELLVRTLSAELCFLLEKSFCYADSASDIPMMALFGKPVAVNPDKKLNRKSLQSKWQILTTA